MQWDLEGKRVKLLQQKALCRWSQLVLMQRMVLWAISAEVTSILIITAGRAVLATHAPQKIPTFFWFIFLFSMRKCYLNVLIFQLPNQRLPPIRARWHTNELSSGAAGQTGRFDPFNPRPGGWVSKETQTLACPPRSAVMFNTFHCLMQQGW